MSAEPSRMLRADAQLNRDRVLEAARELFAARGLDVTMREIARHAGVGPATLYRRFPSKHDLVLAAFHDELRSCEAVVLTAAADPDAWRALCTVIERILVLNAHNQGFTDAFLSAHPDAVDFSGHRLGLLREVDRILRRARAAGTLRPDVVLDDVVLILHAGRGLAALPPASRVRAARRFAALAIDGFRASAVHGVLPPSARLAAGAVAQVTPVAARRDR